MTNGVEGDLRIVGAGLDQEIAAGSRRDQLVAGEMRQIDKGRRPLRAKSVAVGPVLLEQPEAEAEGHGEARRRQVEHVVGIGLRCVVALAGNLDRPALAQRRSGFGPLAQQLFHIGALGGREVEDGDIGVRLRRGDDAALMRAPEGLCRLGRYGVRRGLERPGCARRQIGAGEGGQSRRRREEAASRRLRRQ